MFSSRGVKPRSGIHSEKQETISDALAVAWQNIEFTARFIRKNIKFFYN
jgi:hypothetical protein